MSKEAVQKTSVGSREEEEEVRKSQLESLLAAERTNAETLENPEKFGIGREEKKEIISEIISQQVYVRKQINIVTAYLKSIKDKESI